MYTVVSSCPRCGAPIYAKEEELKGTLVPPTHFTCACRFQYTLPQVNVPSIWQVPPAIQPPYTITTTPAPDGSPAPYVVPREDSYPNTTGTFQPNNGIVTGPPIYSPKSERAPFLSGLSTLPAHEGIPAKPVGPPLRDVNEGLF